MVKSCTTLEHPWLAPVGFIRRSSVIVVSNRIPVTEGQESTFTQRFKQQVSSVEDHNGFIRLHILKSTAVSMHGRAMGRSKCHIGLAFQETIDDFVALTESDDLQTADSNPPLPEMFSATTCSSCTKSFSLRTEPVLSNF